MVLVGDKFHSYIGIEDGIDVKLVQHFSGLEVQGPTLVLNLETELSQIDSNS